ncbi:phage integrase family protein [Azospirillum baldaniorum]|uniref:tyrosine-type recombinase/integrase n=1 Tax=Azospirillum baldaniorum TaxID=1064539 RepID=UPI0011A1FC8E|nr:tyrosine-type recombinase/integrase [Azospirillum baldaniorum]TWA70451.1 phage integrase family protein [Azospirillum baldaniorum]
MPTQIADYVYVRKETGYLFVAITVPPELRAFVTGGPKSKLSKSLGVPPPMTGEAKRKATQAIAEFQNEIEAARKRYEALEARNRADEAKRDARRKLEELGFFGAEGYIGAEDWGFPNPPPPPLSDTFDFVASGWLSQEVNAEILNDAVERIKAAPDSTAQLSKVEAYISAEAAKLDAARNVLDSLKVTTTPKVEEALDSTLTVSRLLEKFLKDHPKTIDTERQYRTAKDIYLSNQDDKPIQKITRVDALAYRSYLQGCTDLSFGTCDQRLKKLRALFNYATKELRALSYNPFEGIQIDQKAKTGHGNELDRASITPEPININLTEIIPTFGRDDSMRWPYLIAFFTGARIEEICGLRMDEVGVRWGINCIHIRPRPEDNRTVKTKEARYAPLHRFLWNELGFGEFVDARREADETMLFTFSQWKKKYYSGKFSAKMTELRAPIEKERNIDLADQHSLRHNLTTLLRNAGVHDEWRCLLIGQSYGSKINAGYGSNDGTLTHINDALHKIDLSDFDFSKLK